MNTKKALLLLSSIVILAGSVGLYTLFIRAGHVSDLVSGDSSEIPDQVSRLACSVFKLDDAQSFLGLQAKQTKPIKSNVINGSQSLTECDYTTPAQDKTISVKLFVSSSDNTLTAFNQAEGSDPQVILGLGQKAYWDPSRGELHVLKGNYWLTTSYKSGSTLATYDVPQQIANKALEQL